MHGRDDLGRGADLLGNLLVVEHAFRGGVEVDELGAGGDARLLPGDEVGVVLHDGDGDLVAGLEHKRGEGLGHQVQRLARIAAEHDVVRLSPPAVVHRPDERGDLRTDLGDGLGRLDGERVQAAQRVGVHGLVERALRIEHAGGALGGGAAVQKRDIGLAREQREIRLIGIHVDIDHAISSSKPSMRVEPRRTTFSRMSSVGAERAASSSFAATNRDSACSWERPRHPR